MLYFEGKNQEVTDYFEKIKDGYQCKVCGKTAEIQSNIYSHVETEHYSPGYSCDICGKDLNTRHNWRRHLRYCKKTHGIEDPIKSTADLEIARFVDSKFGNHMLVDKAGHIYQVNTRNPKGTKIYWICRQKQREKDPTKKCNARATTTGIHVLAWTGEHNHPVIEHQLQNYDRKLFVNDNKTKFWDLPEDYE